MFAASALCDHWTAGWDDTARALSIILNEQIDPDALIARDEPPAAAEEDSDFLVFDDCDAGDAGTSRDDSRRRPSAITSATPPSILVSSAAHKPSRSPPVCIDPSALTLILPAHPDLTVTGVLDARPPNLWITALDGVYIYITWIAPPASGGASVSDSPRPGAFSSVEDPAAAAAA
ncbi:hypothetical protein HK405_003911 [Cladochytrium tenue]|nr:hypothetical protein HK405_003911 [Cladochytrium tenue]